MCQKVDSSVDCHATAGAVSRNDKKRALLLESTFYVFMDY